ncbi:FhaA domain-containing protein [Dactylosporangium sp. NPDC051484]|uniref:FhaA domain-containing protein n=1 Tax=Dactylosporangium sp. NPDC051484 TaxID=3154942 RepID=UPI00344BBA87
MSLPHRLTILRAMQREAEVGEQTLAPNSYLVLVAPADHQHLSSYAPALASSQAEWLAAQGWGVADEVLVDLRPDEDMPAGQFRVVADVRKARTRRGDEAGRGIGLLVGDGWRYTLQAGATVIGRGRQADLRLRDEGVSRRHARLQYDGRALTVTDLGSTNGTTVNDRPVRAAVQVSAGDTIRVGPVTLTVQTER